MNTERSQTLISDRPRKADRTLCAGAGCIASPITFHAPVPGDRPQG